MLCKIVDQQGRNLVYGSASRYIADSIKVLKNAYDFSVHNASVSYATFDSSTLILNFYIPGARSFLYFNQQTKTDTLEISWVDKKAKCCGETFTFASVGGVKFNGVLVQPQNNIYYFIK